MALLVGVQKEYFKTNFPEELAERLDDVPNENLISPPASVAVPAMQGLSYSLDEPELKSMYLELIAKVSDDRSAGKAHPSFAEIIKQLSPSEASLLLKVFPLENAPIVRIVSRAADGNGYNIARNHLLDLRDLETSEPVENGQIPVWIDNWMRLGLVQARYDEHLIGTGKYDWVENRPELSQIRAKSADSDRTIDWQNGVLQVTDFGRQFAEVVSSD